MNSRKSMKLPIILVLIILGVIVYLFTNIKQKEVVCEKITTFDSNIYLKQELTAIVDSQKINSIEIRKTITLPEKYLKDETYLNDIKEKLNKTLEYLGKKVEYNVTNNHIIIEIYVHDNETILLDNINFKIDNGLQVIVNSNTKSSDVVTLKVKDNYNDGELMKRLKKVGYSCK